MKWCTIAGLVGLLVSVGPAGARTWYITASGTGDAPTIAAGIDSASSGDTVLVAAGTYVIDEGLIVKPDLVMCSEEGPLRTTLQAVRLTVQVTVSMRQGAELRGFWVTSGIYSAIGTWSGCRITGNIIAESVKISV